MALLLAPLLLPVLASALNMPVLLNPSVDYYRVGEGDGATIQCTFGFPGQTFQMYRRNTKGNLVAVTNFTIDRSRKIDRTAVSIKATIHDLPVGMNDIVLRTLERKGDSHADCNTMVEVVPAGRVPDITLIKYDYSSFPHRNSTLLACVVNGSSMLPGIMTFEHLANGKRVHKGSRAYYNDYNGVIKDPVVVTRFEGQYSCLAKVWIASSNRSSCIRRPWTLSTAVGTLPSTIPSPSSVATPIFLVHIATSTIMTIVTKTETVVETATISETFTGPKRNCMRFTPVNRTTTVTKTESAPLETTVISEACSDLKGGNKQITPVNCSSMHSTGSCLETIIIGLGLILASRT